ncbi:aldehyde dehydrogenase family protein [Alicyclobacillus curvatus]|nr:aldehyde dehydrogenase family protein [Alicyclobacillus curvatus]
MNPSDWMIERANASEFGLAAYLFTRDVRRVFEVSERLEVEMVAINNRTSISVPQAPLRH